MSDLLNVQLPKWPALLVEGPSVTPEQAAVIILRTDSLWLMCNDHDWLRECDDALGIECEMKDWPAPIWKSVSAARDRFGSLLMQYLCTQRIASSFIGGAHGWIDWEGHLGCGSYNVGKWPSVGDVLVDWQTIAAAFPFLNLRAQLCSGETTEEHAPLVEFTIGAGGVDLHEPGPMIETGSAFDSAFTIFQPRAERGCTIEQLRAAIALTEESLR